MLGEILNEKGDLIPVKASFVQEDKSVLFQCDGFKPEEAKTKFFEALTNSEKLGAIGGSLIFFVLTLGCGIQVGSERGYKEEVILFLREYFQEKNKEKENDEKENNEKELAEVTLLERILHAIRCGTYYSTYPASRSKQIYLLSKKEKERMDKYPILPQRPLPFATDGPTKMSFLTIYMLFGEEIFNNVVKGLIKNPFNNDRFF